MEPARGGFFEGAVSSRETHDLASDFGFALTTGPSLPLRKVLR